MSDNYQEIIEKIDSIREMQEEQDENRLKEEKLKDELEGVQDDISSLESHLIKERQVLQELIDEATLLGEPEFVKPYRPSGL